MDQPSPDDARNPLGVREIVGFVFVFGYFTGLILAWKVVAVVSEVMAGGPVVFALFFGIPFGGLAIITTAVGVILFNRKKIQV